MKVQSIVIVFLLLLSSFYSYSQDISVTVKAIQSTKGTALDSILILNQSNNTVLKVGGLSQDTSGYTICLKKATLTTTVNTVSNQEKISLKGFDSGFKTTVQVGKAQEIFINVYTLDGKTIQTQKFSASAGTNVFSTTLNTKGVFIVKVGIKSHIETFKVILQEPAQIVALSPSTSQFKSGTLDNFVYNEGDRLEVVVKKGDIKSQTWIGRTNNGSHILIAIPKNDATFNMEQTLSSQAQINTIAFSGLAFYSGCFYASSFYPPGKVADYFGFQYLRDNDPDESGHNTDFLTKVAYYVMNILTPTQMQVLIDLAQTQESQFNAYALKRLVLIKGFHRYLDNDLPTGKTTLDIEAVKQVSRELYTIDGEISYLRAIKFAEVINSLTETQKDSLHKIAVLGMQTWVMPDKPTLSIPQGLNTWVMSNASEWFSWYTRDVEADVYFCPERQGTYFGGFYMKDAPAVGNAGYAIDPQATATKGSDMLNKVLTTDQASNIQTIYPMVESSLNGIVSVREKISTELRKAMVGQTVSKTDILTWSSQYGDYDGMYIYTMADQFVKVGRTLTTQQKTDLVKLRDLDAYPCKAGKVFLFSTEIDEPTIPNTDFLFK